MTVTLPQSGTTAHRRRRVVLRALTVAAALALAAPLAPVVLDSAPSHAATRAGVTLTLSPLADGIVEDGEPLTVSLTLENDSASFLPAGQFELDIGRAPLVDRTQLSTWLAGAVEGIAVDGAGTAGADAVASGETATAPIMVEADDPSLAGRPPGVYPLLAHYRQGAESLTATSVMVIPDPTAGPAPLAIIVPITAVPLAAGLLTAEELTELTSPGGALADQLEAVTGTGAVLAVDPSIPAAIRVLGSSAPPEATEWLNRLMQLPNSRFPLQFGDADVAVQIQAGLSQPLQPGSFTGYMDPADFVSTNEEGAPTASPAPTADPEDPELPTRAELLDIGGGRSAVYWPARGVADAEIAESLGATEVDGQSGVTIVASDQTAQDDEAATVAAVASVGESPALVYDSEISALLTTAAVTEETALRGAPLAAVTAMIELAARELDGAPLVVLVDRDPARTRMIPLHAAVTAATGAPSVQTTSLGNLLRGSTTQIELHDAEQVDARVSATRRLVADEVDLDAFATILDDPGLLTGPERASLLQLLGIAWESESLEWEQAVEAHRDATATTLDSVGILPPSPINLYGSGADLGYWVRNDLPYPATVILFATPDDPRLDVQRATEVVASAASNTRAEVPVQARVGSGEVTIALQLRSRTGVQIGDPQSADVSVRADWEGIGIGLLAGLVGVLIIVGLIRTVLRRRAAAREQATDAAGGAATADAAHREGGES